MPKRTKWVVQQGKQRTSPASAPGPSTSDPPVPGLLAASAPSALSVTNGGGALTTLTVSGPLAFILADKDRLIAELSQKTFLLEQERKQLSHKNDQLVSSLSSITAERDDLLKEMADLRETITALEKTIAKLNQTIASHELTINELKLQQDKTSRELHEVKTELNTVKGELASIIEVMDARAIADAFEMSILKTYATNGFRNIKAFLRSNKIHQDVPFLEEVVELVEFIKNDGHQFAHGMARVKDFEGAWGCLLGAIEEDEFLSDDSKQKLGLLTNDSSVRDKVRDVVGNEKSRSAQLSVNRNKRVDRSVTENKN